MKKLKVLFIAFFAGNMLSLFVYALILWVVTNFNITPYGRFVSTFFKGKTPEEAKAYMETNKDLFNKMLPDATHFSNFCITPSVGLFMGFVVGAITATEKDFASVRHGFLLSVFTAVPFAALFWVKAGAVPALLFLGIVGVGGVIGNRAFLAIKSKFEKGDDKIEA